VACKGERKSVSTVLVGKPERDHLEDLDVDRRIILKWTFKKLKVRLWIGFIWLMIGNNARLLCIQQLTFSFHEMQVIS
jgi:hypothetical protein